MRVTQKDLQNKDKTRCVTRNTRTRVPGLAAYTIPRSYALRNGCGPTRQGVLRNTPAFRPNVTRYAKETH